MTGTSYQLIDVEDGVPIKAWTRGVPLEPQAEEQLRNVARLPFIHRWVAAMPDVHWGIGATVGSVIPCVGAIVPAAVGVDIGCGMIAARTTLYAEDLPDDLRGIRSAIEAAVPHGRTNHGGAGDRGAWSRIPEPSLAAWRSLEGRYRRIVDKYPAIARARTAPHLGTLGTGNHFIEVCVEVKPQAARANAPSAPSPESRSRVWFLLHSGSRGIGNRIGTSFIELAKEDIRRRQANLPDEDLAYFKEGSEHFDDYVEAVGWAQDFAATNRRLMMESVVRAVTEKGRVPPFTIDGEAVNCHHNYVAREHHYGKDVFLTRKGAVRARLGDLGIIPGSMGARSFIVRGLGNPESFESCSHGAGRAMSRGEAKRRFTVEDHARATAGVECRKDKDVIDETPMAYKPIDAVMAAQADLVEVVHELRQVVCVKG